MKTSQDVNEIAGKLRQHINGTSKLNMPPPVQLSVYDGSRQFVDGYVWALNGDKRVQCIAPGPLDLTGATTASQVVVWALPPNPDEPGGSYFLIGYAISGATNNRAPALMTTGVTIAGGGGGGLGTVTSVQVSVPSPFSASGGPITTSGTIAITIPNQTANTVYAGPTSGGSAAPAFRSLVAADIPALSYATSPLTTKGDVWGFSSVNARIPIGTDGQVMTADSAQTLGLKWATAPSAAFTITNSSGATANAGDVGYLDFSSGAAVYKKTTTANDAQVFVVVVTGGADTTAISVARTGRYNVNYAGADPAAGDYAISSTTGGQVQAQAFASPNVIGRFQAAGSGGVADLLLLTNRTRVPASSAGTVYNAFDCATSRFESTISGTPSATSVVYGAVTAGNENVIVPNDASALGRLVLWNTTRGTSRIITAVNTATNTITTVSSTDSWANTDVLKIESQTVTSGGTMKFMDLLFGTWQSVIPSNAVELYVIGAVKDSGSANDNLSSHPYETFAAAKQKDIYTQVANVYTFVPMSVPIINSRVTIGWIGSGAATIRMAMYLVGYTIPTP